MKIGDVCVEAWGLVTTSFLLLSDRSDSPDFERVLLSLSSYVRRVDAASTALDLALRTPPSLIIIDCRDDPAAAVQLCKSFRSVSETCLLPLVAVVPDSSTTGERIDILEAGADDCWAERVDSREFLLRLKGFVRRLDAAQDRRILRYADIELDLDRYKVWRNGRAITVTPMQFKLLRHLLENPLIVFSREQLLELVWKDDGLDAGAVTACVARLRRALNAGGMPNLIKSIPAAGYALDGEDAFAHESAPAA